MEWYRPVTRLKDRFIFFIISIFCKRKSYTEMGTTVFYKKGFGRILICKEQIRSECISCSENCKNNNVVCKKGSGRFS